MRKFCFIGNSHVAAFKQGWSNLKQQHPRLHFDFFASGGRTIKDVEFKGDLIVPRTKFVENMFEVTSRGQNSICIPEYEGFFLVGMGLGDRITRGLYRTHRLDMHVNDRDCQIVSENFFVDSAEGAARRDVCVWLHEALQAATSRPVVSLPQSHLSEDAVGTDRYPASLKDSGDGDDLARLFDIVLDRLRVGGMEIVTQHPDTKRTSSLTKRDYCIGSFKLKGKRGHSIEDFSHNNESYGRLMFGELLKRIV